MASRVDPRVRFEELYRSNAGVVLAFVRRRAHEGGAEDGLSEGFLIAWRRLEDVPESRSRGCWESPGASWETAAERRAEPRLYASAWRMSRPSLARLV